MRLLLGILFATGCAKDVTKDLEDLATRACGCAEKKDTACGKAVLADMVKLGESKNIKGDERKSAESAKKIGECLLKSGVKSSEISDAIRPKEQKAPPPGEPTPAGAPPTPGSGSGSAEPPPAPSGSGSGSSTGSGSGSAR